MDQNNELQGSNQPIENGASLTPSTEKLVPQSKVDEIVRHSNARVAEKARSEEAEKWRHQESPQQAPSIGGMPSITPDQIRAIVAEENQKHLQAVQHQAAQQQGDRIAQEFFSKLTSGSHLHPDFNETVSELPYGEIPGVVALANNCENTAEIMYELAKNPLKLANIDSLTKINPNLANKEMSKLAASIKLNAEAKNAKVPNSPLTQIKSSPVNTDSGSMTVSDFRKMFRA